MVLAAKGWSAVRVYLEMIKFEHSIFALPFAMIGMMWGSWSSSGGVTPWPGWTPFGLIVLAMVAARSAAMAYNRIADRDVDALNPRTASRALPSGALGVGPAKRFLAFSVAVFFLAAAALNPLALALSPIALFVTLFYSRTKRFTPLCHVWLGMGLGIAPAAAWIGVAGSLDVAVLPLVAAVVAWTAGFDIIYSLQDENFDRSHGLRSLPEAIGASGALLVSRSFHFGAVVFLALAGIAVGAGSLWWVGVAFAGVLLAYEQSLVRPQDLRRVNVAFFTLNGFVGLGLLGFAVADMLWRTASAATGRG